MLIFAVANFLQKRTLNAVRRIAIEVQSVYVPLQLKFRGAAAPRNNPFKDSATRFGRDGD